MSTEILGGYDDPDADRKGTAERRAGSPARWGDRHCRGSPAGGGTVDGTVREAGWRGGIGVLGAGRPRPGPLAARARAPVGVERRWWVSAPMLLEVSSSCR